MDEYPALRWGISPQTLKVFRNVTRVTGILVLGLGYIPCLRAAEQPADVVLYTALRPANWDVFLFADSESQPRRLTEDPALDYNPTFSPDGKWVVFCSERRGNPDLFVADLNSSDEPRLLLDSTAMEDAAAFAPNGNSLVFVGTRDGNADVFTIPFSPDEIHDDSQAVNLTNHKSGDFNPAISPDGQWIAFASDRDGYKASEIYVMAVDGTQVKRLTHSAGWDGSPAWSVDGQMLFFYSERDGQPRIYSMTADGKNKKPVTPKEQSALSPVAMSADRISYAVKADGRWLIESRNLDGSEPRRLGDSGTNYWAPAYDLGARRLICYGITPSDKSDEFNSRTPGSFLIDQRHRVDLTDRTVTVIAIRGYFPSVNLVTGEVATDERFERIVISRLDGTESRVAYTPAAGKAWRPTWSKDGKWLACSIGQTFAGPQASISIWKFRPDGSDAINLTSASAHNNAFPDFSPDGDQIVFRSGRSSNHEIYLMNADGSDIRRLTKHDAIDTMPAFSSQGDRITFTSNRDGDYEIYLLNLLDGKRPGRLQRLTDSPGRDTHPKFSPDGKWLVFASERGGMNDESPLIPVFNPQPYGDIYALRISDGSVIRLTHNKWEDGTPTWAAMK